MIFSDILLQLSSYPEPTRSAAIEGATAIAKALQARISALIVSIESPGAGNALANALLDIPAMVAAERRKSLENAQSLSRAFDDITAASGVAHDRIIEASMTSLLPGIVTEHARLRDVTIIPIGGQNDLQQYIAESVIFGSGRPTIVLPEFPKNNRPFSLDVVAVAWDFSRSAARALADAMPILRHAKTVVVITITQEKTINTTRSPADLARHLSLHGIEVNLEEEKSAGRPIGEALAEYAVARGVDLLVMGAYGHSRMRDFVLGGATKAIVAHPPLPVFLSH